MTDAEAATRLIHRYAREIDKAIEARDRERIMALVDVPVRVWLETIAQEAADD